MLDNDKKPTKTGITTNHDRCCGIKRRSPARIVMAVSTAPVYTYIEDHDEERFDYPTYNYEFERIASETQQEYMLYLSEPRMTSINNIKNMIGINTLAAAEWATLGERNIARLVTDFNWMLTDYRAGKMAPVAMLWTVYTPEQMEENHAFWTWEENEAGIEVPYYPLTINGFAADRHLQNYTLKITPESQIRFMIQFDGPMQRTDFPRNMRQANKWDIQSGGTFMVPHPKDCSICATQTSLAEFDTETLELYAKHREELLEELKL